ncbi:MAG TPA: EamA family transporter [Clostridia bacterium]|nr:EamA family transporter [Clostridia bacterium]
MDILYALGTALLLFAQGPIYKLYNKKCVLAGKTNDFLFNMINFGTGLAILAPIAFWGKPVDYTALIWGLINGILFCSMLVFYNKSLQIGKIAFVNFMMSIAIFIPLLGSLILFGESISVIQWIALAVLLAASYLVSYGQKSEKCEADEDKKTKTRLWIFVLIGLIANGGLSLFIKSAYVYNPGIDQTQFLFGSYFMALFSMTIFAAFTTKGFTQAKNYVPNKWFLITGLMVGVVTVFGNMIFTIFSVRTEAALFYPITGVLPMLLAALISPLLKEKLSKTAVFGIITGMIAIVMLNL